MLPRFIRRSLARELSVLIGGAAGLALGATEYLTKPVERQALVAAVHRLLRSSDGAVTLAFANPDGAGESPPQSHTDTPASPT